MENWDYSPFWDEVVRQVSEELNAHEFSMWFNVQYDSSSKDTIRIRVPSVFYRDQLEKKYKKMLEQKLLAISGHPLSIEFLVTLSETKSNEAKSGKAQLDNMVKETSKLRKDAPKPVQQEIKKHPQLNLGYTFDNYVVGDNNSFAANAAIAIANNPGSAYNPFLIYGGVGLGKTHLMQAVGNKTYEKYPNKKIICVTAEEFTGEYIDAIHNRDFSVFKNKYRSVDLLLVDDIHFFENKEGFQDEMFYTFNALYDSGKQMVFTCDRPASELKNLTDRLRSRFERGLKVDLQPPNYETRVAILKTKAESLKLQLPQEVLEIVARNVATNIRDLESALITLTAYVEITGKEITLTVAKDVLKDIFNQFRHINVSIDHIVRAVSDHFKVSSNDIKGKKRSKKIVFPRQIAMYIARDITEYSTTELGLEFGGRDHTTVMHSVQKIDELIKIDPSLKTIIERIIQNIKNQKNT
jgi:chromosomal replication initiator protein